MSEITHEMKSSGVRNIMAVIIILIGLQFLKIPWILDLFVKYPKFDFDEYGYIFIPFLLFPVVQWMFSKVIMATKRNAKQILGVYLAIVVLLIIQVLVEWVYYTFQYRFLDEIPTEIPLGYALPSLWLSNEQFPLMIFTVWFYLTWIIFVPLLIALLKANFVAIKGFKQEFHSAFTVIGLIMVWRQFIPIGPNLYNILVSLIFIPVTLFSIFKPHDLEKSPLYAESDDIKSIHVSFNLAFLFGFIFMVLEFQSSGQMADAYVWWIAVVGNLMLMFFNSKNWGWEQSNMGKKILLVVWWVVILSSIFYVIGFLSSPFNLLYRVFLAISSLFLVLIPEFMVTARPIREGKEQTDKIKMLILIIRDILVGIYFLVGLVISAIINIEDPISSYAVIVFLTIAGIVGFLELIKKRT